MNVIPSLQEKQRSILFDTLVNLIFSHFPYVLKYLFITCALSIETRADKGYVPSISAVTFKIVGDFHVRVYDTLLNLAFKSFVASLTIVESRNSGKIRDKI